MTLLNDEMVEKLAAAIFAGLAEAGRKAGGTGYVNWSDAPIAVRGLCRDTARAALLAVIPDVVEECAKVADEAAKFSGEKMKEAADDLGASYNVAFGATGISEDIASRIRSLLGKGE